MALSKPLERLLKTTADSLSGHAKRLFLARTVQELFGGKAYRAERALGWNRTTLRKSLHELRSGFECVDGRKGMAGNRPVQARLPTLLDDIKAICDGQSQADPTFRTHRLYTRLSAGQVRRELIVQKGYTDAQLPCEQTIRNKLNQLGYHPQRVQKSRPKKKSPSPTRSLTK